MIITLDLCLRNGDRELIDGLNLHIEKGEFIFVCGQAGTGKTSLLRILALQQPPAGGSVIVDGTDIATLSRHKVPEYLQGLGIIFQDDALLEHRTVAENISISLELCGWPPASAKEETRIYLKAIGLAGRAGLFPNRISENEKQMLGICRALARRPKIVLADEPFEGLDWQSIEKANELFSNANLRGSTILIATHHAELARQSGKRAILLDRNSLGRMAKTTAA